MNKKIVIFIILTVLLAGVILLLYFTRDTNKYEDYIEPETTTSLELNSDASNNIIMLLDSFVKDNQATLQYYGVLEEDLYKYTITINYNNKITAEYKYSNKSVYVYIQLDNESNIQYSEIWSSEEAG